jgi:hypothetical protein
VILAAVSEGVLWTMNASYGRFIDNGNALGVGTFMFHVPGMLITDSLGLPGGSRMADRIIITFGAIQFFLIYWGVIAIWTRVHGRHNAEPGARPSGGPAGVLSNSARSGRPR